MSPWDGASRWINTVLLVIVGFVGFDTLFRLLEANERNVIVGFTRAVGGVLLAPFDGMFEEDQDYLLTSLIAVLGYALVAGIAMAVIRSVQASRRRSREAAAGGVPIVGRTEPQPGAGTQPLPPSDGTGQGSRGMDGTADRGWQSHTPSPEAPTQDLGGRSSEPRRQQQDAQTQRLPADPAGVSRPAPAESPRERNGGVHRS